MNLNSISGSKKTKQFKSLLFSLRKKALGTKDENLVYNVSLHDPLFQKQAFEILTLIPLDIDYTSPLFSDYFVENVKEPFETLIRNYRFSFDEFFFNYFNSSNTISFLFSPAGIDGNGKEIYGTWFTSFIEDDENFEPYYQSYKNIEKSGDLFIVTELIKTKLTSFSWPENYRELEIFKKFGKDPEKLREDFQNSSSWHQAEEYFEKLINTVFRYYVKKELHKYN